MRRRQLTLAVLVLIGSVPVAYVTCQNQRQLDPCTQGEEEVKEAVRRRIEALKADGSIHQIEGSQCVVGPHFADFDSGDQWIILHLAYESIGWTGPPENQPVMIVRNRAGQTIGRYTPQDGFVPYPNVP